jgi:plastocyanin
VVEPAAAAPAIEVAQPNPAATATPLPISTPTPAATPTAAPAAGPVAATLVDNRFQPSALTVAPGTTVTWTNNGFNLHTLTSPDGLFDSGALAGGQSFSYTFQKAGTFVVICRQHVLNGMTGRITVQ